MSDDDVQSVPGGPGSSPTVRLRRGPRPDAGLQAGQARHRPGRRDRLQAVVQREPLRTAPVGADDDRRGGGVRQPLSRHGGRRAARASRSRPRRLGRLHRDRDRVSGRPRPDRPGCVRRGRRGGLRVAVVRGVPDRHPAGRRHFRRGRSRRPGPAPARRDGGRRHRAHAGGARLHAEQPHRAVGAPRRSSTPSSTGSPATSSSSSTRPTSSSSGMPRRSAVSRCGASDPTSSSCAPSPRRMAWRGCESASPSPTVTSPPRSGRRRRPSG